MSLLLLGVSGSEKIALVNGPLDTYGPGFAAFSMSRNLVSTYTGQPKFRVRRSSDNALLDITGDTNAAIEAQVLAHCGANDGFVDRVYDQTGNGRHRAATLLGGQAFGIEPRVCLAGVVDKVNGFVCARFLNGDHALKANSSWLTRDTAYNWHMVYKHPAAQSLMFTVGINQYSFVAANGDGASAHNQINTAGTSYKNGVATAAVTRDNVFDNYNTNTLISHAIEGWNPDDFWNDIHQFGGYGEFDGNFPWIGYYVEEIISLDSVQSNSDFNDLITVQRAHYSL